jgi:GTPase
MFVDEVRLRVVAGNGGDGVVSFRREKFAPRGGPDGGDGGKGGDVILLVDPDLRTLLHLRHQNVFRAERGGDGGGKQCFGPGGSDCLIRLPPGTIVRDANTGEWIADLVTPGSTTIVTRGGRGGKGNVHFKSSTRRTPRIATPGEEGEARDLFIELRLLADVGLVGLPNVGKSTLLARVSNAQPRIGDYPFTTLQPNLGIVGVGASFSFVMADIPGLIEGAHEGRGLGIGFLKHIERTRLLLFLLDSMSEDPVRDYEVLRHEVESFSESLARRPRVIAFSRADVRDASVAYPSVDGIEAIAFSAHTGEGLDALLWRLRDRLVELETATPAPAESKLPPRESAPSDLPFALMVDRGADLGPRPWPDRYYVGVIEDGEVARDGTPVEDDGPHRRGTPPGGDEV